MIEQLILVGLGVFTGFVSALLGLGGGVLVVPLLPTVVDIPYTEVVATSLCTIFLVVSVNAFFFHRDGLVRWDVALRMGPVTAVSAILAAKLAPSLPVVALKLLLAVLLLVTAMKALMAKPLPKAEAEGLGMSKAVVIWALIAGVVSGFTGIGSGVILGTILVSFGLVKNQQVSPTSNGIMMFTTFAATLGYFSLTDVEGYRFGLVHADVALVLFLSATVVAKVMRPLQAKITAKARKAIFVSLLSLLSVKVLYGAVASFFS